MSKDEDDKTPAYWVDSSYLRNHEHKIYNIEDYETYEIEIDFNYPQLAQNKIIEMTIAVEDECPVGKAFGHMILTDNTAYEENGKIWFERENGFTDVLRNQLKDEFIVLRNKYPTGINKIFFTVL